jgi:4-hydroxy-tetrahydrodipicolinate synthase
MKLKRGDKRLSGVWSAMPTPLTGDLKIDKASVKRMVEHHVRLGVKGLFVAGTCGEGAWLTPRQIDELIATTAKATAGRMLIAAQVTDNSVARVLENIDRAAAAGADIAVIAPPNFLLNATPENLTSMYRQAVRQSKLPVGIYDRGRHGAVPVPIDVLCEIVAEKNVVLLKDSSSDPERREKMLAARKKSPGFGLLNGDEFNCIDYLKAGYDGVLLGGAVLTGYIAGQMIDAARAGDNETLGALQRRTSQLLFDVYGGEKITCWLTGLKQTLVEMKIFSTNRNILNYPLTPSCKQAIKTALKRDKDILFPREKPVLIKKAAKISKLGGRVNRGVARLQRV